MGVRFRDDLGTSVRLLTGTDRWVAIDLVAGVAGYVVWVAGSAALGLQVASLADYAVAPGGTPTTPVLGLFALLWLVLPAALGVARVRSRLLNLRNNVEQAYRFDRPGALLVPPAALLAVGLVAVVAMGTVHPLLFVVLAPATLFLLVRTIAYSYRVYAFSHPLSLYAALFVTLAVQAAVLLLSLGLATENGPIVRATITAVGLAFDPLATVDIAGLSAPAGPAVAVALPIGLVAVYLAIQTLAAVLVRVRQPTIQPSATRTGQRYPPWLDVAADARRSSVTSSASDSESTDGDASGTDDGDADPSTDSAVGATASGPAANEDAADAEAESVSHTRVFTPPADGGDDPLASVDSDDEADCENCGAAVPADARRCPACGADAA